MHFRFLTFLIAHWGIPPKFLFTLLESLTSIQNFLQLLLIPNEANGEKEGYVRENREVSYGAKRGDTPLTEKNAKYFLKGSPFMQSSHLLNLCRYLKACDQDFVADVW